MATIVPLVGPARENLGGAIGSALGRGMERAQKKKALAAIQDALQSSKTKQEFLQKTIGLAKDAEDLQEVMTIGSTYYGKSDFQQDMMHAYAVQKGKNMAGAEKEATPKSKLYVNPRSERDYKYLPEGTVDPTYVPAELKKSAVDKPEKERLTDQKIAYYKEHFISQGDSPEVADAKAHDLAYGNVTISTTPDQFGNLYSTNKRLGTSEVVKEGKGKVGSEGQQVAGSQEQPSVSAQTPSGKGSARLEQAAEVGAGFWPTIRRVIGGAVGGVTGGTLPKEWSAPEATAAQREMEHFNTEAKRALVLNQRFPVYEQQQYEKLIPTGKEFLQDPRVVADSYRTLRGRLEYDYSENTKELDNQTISLARRKELVDKNSSIRYVMGLMDQGGGAGSQAVSRAQELSQKFLNGSISPDEKQELIQLKQQMGR